ncbi:MAG TPA: FAD-dependent oxidoreductase, partial [Victivallales bacterium]|nr:FAD-dependent oxidoreductase [Victivallales bacterium]
MKKEKVVVIGVNHAGTSAVRTLLAQNPDLEVVAFDRNDNISFLGCGIALAVGGIVKNVNDLFYCNEIKLSEMGAKIYMLHEVIAIDTKTKRLTVKDLKSGKIFYENYDKLVYAAGSWPMSIPGLPKESMELENVMLCKLFQHARELIDKADEPGINSVVVIGAGYIGIELAEAYRIKGKNVTLLDYEKRVIPRYFDHEFTNSLEEDIRNAGIKLGLGEKVINFEGKDNKVNKVITNKNSYPADLVILCVGFKPNTELLPDAEKTANGAIIVDPQMRTNIPDIWAIGDSAAMLHAATGRHTQVALATNAVKSGIAAASSINGISGVEVQNIAGTNAIHVFDNNLASTGLTEQTASALGIKAKSVYVEDADRPEFMQNYTVT